jgi:hypothetical protein
MAFFNSPGKAWLIAQQKKRIGKAELRRNVSSDNLGEKGRSGPMGLPDDPSADLEEIRKEMMEQRDRFNAKRASVSTGKKGS